MTETTANGGALLDSNVGDNERIAAKENLCSLVERIETLEEQKQALADDIKDVWAEVKDLGFSNVALREVLSERKKRAKQGDFAIEEKFQICERYREALGMPTFIPAQDAESVKEQL